MTSLVHISISTVLCILQKKKKKKKKKKNVVYHKCELCGKLVLLDGDFLGAHIKNKHKMKESVYYNQYMINNPAKSSKKQSKKNK